MSNFPTSPIIVPADPNVEGAGSGVNGGAGCNPGIGIATDNPDPKASDWSRETRDPVGGQYLGWGGDSVETGQETADIPPIKVVEYAAADFNDTAVFALADTLAVTGVVYDTVTGAVNVGVQTIVVGVWAWGAVPVA